MTRITCDRGCCVAEYDGSLAPGEHLVAELFHDYAPEVEPATNGSVITTNCPVCGVGRFLDIRGPFIMGIHTEEGWKP